MKIYSIKNEKLGFFNRPIYCESSSEALSLIQNILMSDSDRALKGLRGDLSLYLLGDIDFETGIIYPELGDAFEDYELNTAQPRFICSLEEIFLSIPEDKIISEGHELRILRDYCKELEAKIDSLKITSDHLENHYHTKKGDIVYDS